MRASRILSAVVASAMIVLPPLTLSAAAAPDVAPRATTIHVGANVHKEKGHLVMAGFVRPSRGPVIIKKATHCNIKTATCNFKRYHVAHFDKRVAHKGGHYEVRIEAPKHGSWYWQANVGGNKSRIWQTCTTTTGGC